MKLEEEKDKKRRLKQAKEESKETRITNINISKSNHKSPSTDTI